MAPRHGAQVLSTTDSKQIDFYGKAFDLLVEYCQVRSNTYPGRDAFIDYYVNQGGTEWRFQGNLGYGGKFWRRHDGWDINAYQEDYTKERKAIIKKVNGLLKELAAEIGIEP